MKIGLQTWGSDGDIRPFLALAGGLRARGHEVSLAVTSVDNKNYSSFGKEMDFTVTHVGQLNYEDKAIRDFQDKIIGTSNSLKQIELILDYFFNPVKAEMFNAAERLCKENDLIIGHYIHYPVSIAAEKAGKPYTSVMLNHAGIYSKHTHIYGVPDLGKWMNPFWWKLFNFVMDRSIGAEANKLRKRVGLPFVHKVAETVLTSKDLNLVAETSAIGQKQPDWPDHHHVCGVFTIPNAAEQWTMPDDLKRFLETGLPPVFITLGSMFSLDTSPGIITETLVQSALLAGCRAIVQAPWDELPDFPDHPQIYKLRKAPHQNIFPHCSAVVHHGGAGTTHSATLHGCPSIVIEHIADQTFFAGELERLGVAPKVLHRRTITAKKLAKSIRTVLDNPGMKKRAEALREIMLKENGVQKAVDLIEMHSLRNTSNSSDRVKHSVIIIPALKTNSAIFDFITKNWYNKYGLSVHVLNAWNTEKDFSSMLEKVINKIDELSNNGDAVSLLGASGGGNLAINAFIKRKGKVNKVINVCGRMRVGKHNDLDISSGDKQLKAYIESIHFLESNIDSLSSEDKKKIMTIRPRFGQEFVPVDTVTIDGGNNIVIPTFEHILSIVAALTIFKRLLISFVKSEF